MPFSLVQRHALVTGCGSAHGIGFASARLLHRLGARVSITSTTERIHDRAAELGGAFAYPADLTDPRQALALAAAACDAHGSVDILVNNAGMVQTGFPYVGGPFVALEPAALQRQLDITLKTAFHLTQAVLPSMVETGYGRVVMISSVTGPLVTAPGSAAYAAAKAGLDGLMRTIAVEHGRDGITVNAVGPGMTDNGRLSPEMKERFLALAPLGRLAAPEEVARVVAFLASPASDHITGAHVNVGGGWGLK